MFTSESHNMYIILKKLIRLHLAAMMMKDCKPLIQLQHIHIDTNTEKACETKLLLISFDDYTNKNKTENKWQYIPYRILITGNSGSGKNCNIKFDKRNQPDIDVLYLYAKDPYEAKYQYLITKREKVGFNNYDNP